MARRIVIAAGAGAILVAAAVIARIDFRSGSPPASPAGSPAAARPAETHPSGAAGPAAVNVEGAAQRFERTINAASPGTWTYIAEGPVVSPGALDEWDDFAIGYVSVLRDGDAKGSYQLWYQGCSLGVRGQRCAIGHAASSDGIRWKKTPGPIFVPPEPQATADLRGVTVVRGNDRYYMWYSIAPSWFDGRKVSTLHLATSADGRAWEGKGQVFAGIEQIERHLDPSALWDGSRFHLWVVDSMLAVGGSAAPPDGAPLLRHLISSDGREWKESGSFPLASLGIGRVRPTVAARARGGYRAVLFDQNAIALLWIESNDGDTWQLASPPKAELHIPPPEEVETLDDATALDGQDGTFAWLVAGKDGRNGVRLGFLRR